MGFRTVPDAMRAAGNAAGGAVAELRGADCGEPVGRLTAALPGSIAGAAASSFGSAWQRAFATWCTDAERYAADLAAAADAYRAGDDRAAGGLADAGTGPGPR